MDILCFPNNRTDKEELVPVLACNDRNLRILKVRKVLFAAVLTIFDFKIFLFKTYNYCINFTVISLLSMKE